MDDDEEIMDIEELFEVFSNSTRRKILELLSSEALYPFQISKILEISPRIIGKYISELEELGLVKTIEKKSDKGPVRRYAQIDKTFSIMIDIGPNNFSWKVVPIETETSDEEVQTTGIRKIRESDIRSIEEVKNSIKKKVAEVVKIDNKRKELVADINECFKIFNDLLENTIEEYIDRVYVRTLLREMVNMKQEWISSNHLSNTLREWRGDIRNRLIKLAEETGIVKYKFDNRKNDYLFSI
ncbi:MAG: ArsR family transcriptional regulator [Candidatus Heimdallarchaeum aukensis]|uniref:ArsR family transcriptional regulator n=1 Tax=Candidatus Heimdallarchaeum aukensis TaxID=2876573 RepID=A0A9Y1FJF7_9ARCH|nr:MAG: ArsR family transcriptional regulator [Candidatus Heimdallarchaeum aukensis]